MHVMSVWVVGTQEVEGGPVERKTEQFDGLPHEYLQVGDALYRLQWQQSKMRECFYRRVHTKPVDVIPAAT